MVFGSDTLVILALDWELWWASDHHWALALVTSALTGSTSVTHMSWAWHVLVALFDIFDTSSV
jgi:hypothetical protein